MREAYSRAILDMIDTPPPAPAPARLAACAPPVPMAPKLAPPAMSATAPMQAGTGRTRNNRACSGRFTRTKPFSPRAFLVRWAA